MSYIVPRDIPKNCRECPCGYETERAFRDECSVLAREYEKDADSVRPYWCPLVEVPTPHGRLIDANEIEMPCLETTADQKWMEIAIKSTPTVIEAEGSEE